MKCTLCWIISIVLLSCASGGMYQSEPCDNLPEEARDECLKYLPATGRSAEKKGIPRYLPTQERYEQALQAIDRFTDGVIDYLFY